MLIYDSTSLLLLSAILIPMLVGVVLLGGGAFSETKRRAVAAIGFSWPLIVCLVLYSIFDPSLAGAYNFELKLPTGLESIGIYLHLGLNGVSMPLFILAGIVGLAAGLYSMNAKAERPHLYLSLLLFMQCGLMGTFASIDVFFFYFFLLLLLLSSSSTATTFFFFFFFLLLCSSSWGA